MAARWAVRALSVVLCVGCRSNAASSAASEESGVDAGGPRVVLGTGREEFEALGSEGTIDVIKGFQGGFHVWVSLQAYGFDTDVVRMDLSTHWGTGDASLLEMSGVIGLQPGIDAAGEQVLSMAGWPALVFDPSCAHGQALDVVVSVTDGHSAGDTRRWILNVAEADRSADCGP